MQDDLMARAMWCLRNYHNAARQGRVVSTDVQQTAADALREYDMLDAQLQLPIPEPTDE